MIGSEENRIGFKERKLVCVYSLELDYARP